MTAKILITGAARGLGSELAKRLSANGSQVFLAGLELESLKATSKICNNAPYAYCDVRSLKQVKEVFEEASGALGGLDVIVANAGIAAQTPIIGNNPELFYKIIEVNLLGCFNTVHVGAPYIGHRNGYMLIISSLAAAVHLPLMSAYSASKAAVEALGNTLRIELAPTGAKVGIAYFSEIDTDMTKRGFNTQAASILTGGGSLTKPAPIKVAIDALELAIQKRKRKTVAPFWVEYVLHVPSLAQRIIELGVKTKIGKALEVASQETVEMTTPQPDINVHEQQDN